MSMQTYALTPARIGKFKGDILAFAEPFECLALQGRQVKMPKNNSDTYVARRFVPYGASTTNPNIFFANGTGDRGNAVAAAHVTQEGVTPTPDNLQAIDYTEVIVQYSCLYGFTDKAVDLYEDDIPANVKMILAKRIALVNEMIVYGKLKACTNAFYGGTGTSRATVNGPMTLSLQSSIIRSLLANHATPVTEMLAPSNDYGTSPVEKGYYFYTHTDLERQIRDLPGFVTGVRYASGKPIENELGSCERARYVLSPDLVSFQDAGAAIATWTGSGTGYSTTGTSLDVYVVIALAADAFSQIAVRGLDSLDPTFMAPGEKSKSDPLGQRGYAGSKWWKAVLLENVNWMAITYVARAA